MEILAITVDQTAADTTTVGTKLTGLKDGEVFEITSIDLFVRASSIRAWVATVPTSWVVAMFIKDTPALGTPKSGYTEPSLIWRVGDVYMGQATANSMRVLQTYRVDFPTPLKVIGKYLHVQLASVSTGQANQVQVGIRGRVESANELECAQREAHLRFG